jgi:hypothetical protein
LLPLPLPDLLPVVLGAFTGLEPDFAINLNFIAILFVPLALHILFSPNFTDKYRINNYPL